MATLRSRPELAPIAFDQLLVVFLGGCVGALGRATLAGALPWTGGWPWATFTANLIGAALLAWIAVHLGARRPEPRVLQSFLCTGLCGALTTFSALQVEVIELAREGAVTLAASYLVVSVTLGIGVVAIVTQAARRRVLG